MIIRAVFWIGLVAFLMPQEPDLGFGRPGAGSTDQIGRLIASTQAPQSSIVSRVHTIAMRNLEQVRADLAANGHGYVTVFDLRAASSANGAHEFERTPARTAARL